MQKSQFLRRALLSALYGVSMLAAQFVAAGELGEGLGLPYLVGVVLAFVILSPFKKKVNGVERTFAILPWPKVRTYGTFALLFGGLFFAAKYTHLYAAGYIALMLLMNLVFRHHAKKWKIEFEQLQKVQAEKAAQSGSPPSHP